MDLWNVVRMNADHRAPADEHHVSDAVLARAAEMFAAVANPDRLRLLECLRAGEACVSGLAEHLDEPITTTSNRLRTLARAGLVSRRREERHQYYSLADEHVVRLLDLALEHAGHD